MQVNRSLIAAIALILAAVGVFFIVQRERTLEPVASAPFSLISSSALAESIAQPEAPPAGYVAYTNERYGFSFYHSPEARIRAYDESGGAATIVLEDITAVRGFQLFIVPYAGEMIAEARFLADVPSGVRENVEQVFIGAQRIEAVTFTSYDSSLGETREVWFLHGGYLYEVTTFSGGADWLVPVLQTWRFH